MGPLGSFRLNLPLEKAAPGASTRAGLVGLAAIAGFALLASPIKLCLVAAVLHIPCPGCGLTRAAFALARGDVGRAVAFHPLSIVVIPVVACLLAVQAFSYVRTGSAWSAGRMGKWTEVLLAATALLLMAVWVARLCGAFGGPVAV